MQRTDVMPEHFPTDAGDPVVRFLRDYLRVDWPQAWLVSFLIYGPIEKLILPTLGGYGHLGPDVRLWRPDIESMLTGFVWFPFCFAFYLWMGSDIANVFRRLGHNASFKDPEAYTRFIRTVYASMSRLRWWFIGLGMAALAVLLVAKQLWGPHPKVEPWFDGYVMPRYVSLVLVGGVAYVVSQILIREWLTLYWWRRMWREVPGGLVLHPFHPDEACGLSAVGLHAIGISYFLAVMTLFVFMGSVLPSLRSDQRDVVADTILVTAPAKGVRWLPPCTSAGTCAGIPWELGMVAANGKEILVTVALDSARDTVRTRLRRLGRHDVLRLQVTKLTSQTVALDTTVVMDSLHRGMRAFTFLNRLGMEPFEISVVSVHAASRLDVPTVTVWGIRLYVWSPLIPVEWGLLLIVTVATLGFILWPTHEAMEEARERELNGISQDIEELLAAARRDAKTDPAKVPATLEGIERAKQVRTVFIEQCDTWPISRNLRVHLKITSAIPVVTSFLQLLGTGFLALLRGP